MSSNLTAEPKQERRNKRKSGVAATVLKILTGIVGVIIVAAVIVLGTIWLKLSPGSKHMIAPMIGPGRPTVPQQFPGQDSMNLMIIGRDYDYTNQDVEMKTSARADLLMMAKLDFANNKVYILSIPRDTKATIPGWPPSKINSAEEKGGPTLTAETVKQNFNIPEDHYVAIDFEGFQQAINDLGGVDLTVDKKMDYDDNWGFLHIHLKPGFQHLDGYNAMGFVRFRHSDSDMVRTKRQQALLAALKTKIDQPGVLFVLPQLINVINSSAATDLTDNQKAALAWWFKSVPKENYYMTTCPSIAGPYYVYTDWPKAAPIIKSWFGVDPPAGTSMVEPVAVGAPVGHHRHHMKAQPL